MGTPGLELAKQVIYQVNHFPQPLNRKFWLGRREIKENDEVGEFNYDIL
jgi:hypothetical protein